MASTIEHQERPRLTLKEMIERKEYLSVGSTCLFYLCLSPVILVVGIITVPIMLVADVTGRLVVLMTKPWIKPK